MKTTKFLSAALGLCISISNFTQAIIHDQKSFYYFDTVWSIVVLHQGQAFYLV